MSGKKTKFEKTSRKSGKNSKPGPTIKRSDLVDKICADENLNRQLVVEILNATLNEIGTTLSDGKTVKISSFGTFSLLQKSERVGRNPRTGSDAVITPRQVVSFRASPIFKKTVGNN